MGGLAHDGIVLNGEHHTGQGRILPGVGRRQKADDAVHQLPHPHPQLGRGQQNRRELPRPGGPGQGFLQRLVVHRAALQIGVLQSGIRFGRGQQRLLPESGIGKRAGPDGADGIPLPLRPLHGQAGGGQLPADLIEHIGNAAARPVDFIDHQQDGEIHAAQGFPQQEGVGLHPLHGGEHQNRAVQRGQAALHLPREVHVAGRVDELDDASAVFQPGAGGFHRNASPLFHLQPVGLCGALVHVARLPHGAAQIQQLFGQGGFARVHVGENPDIADIRHGASLPRAVISG